MDLITENVKYLCVRKCDKVKGKLVKWFVINIIGMCFNTLLEVGGKVLCF